MVDVLDMLEDVGLFEQFCGTWVRGAAPDVVAAAFEAEAASKSTRTMAELNNDLWQLSPYRPVLLAGSIGADWTFIVERQSCLGADLARLVRLSDEGRLAFNVNWTVNLAGDLIFARDGVIVSHLSLTNPYLDRSGSAPDELDPLLRRAVYAGPPNFNNRVAAAFDLAARLTGTTLGPEWFETRQTQYLAPERR
ncbi:hypothetical protein FDA94_35535 [Herbidospora galbida]|uniref:Uncharacterized protein n=1 Tax=Herbidospora galbida TaxID=2575442 RepID=A0A4U3M0E6_9ACTN|nr:DUF6461 domain-containing protein [Herbidospora galbida]TKK80706.1 hypothetical protein FDA94_35535 [Herbidospora galbida]